MTLDTLLNEKVNDSESEFFGSDKGGFDLFLRELRSFSVSFFEFPFFLYLSISFFFFSLSLILGLFSLFRSFE